MAIQTSVLGITAILVLLYFRETRRQANLFQEEAKDASAVRLFDTFTKILDRLQGPGALLARRQLYRFFEGALGSAVQQSGILTASDLKEVTTSTGRHFRVDAATVLAKVDKDDKKLDELNQALMGKLYGDLVPLDVVEEVLVDLDLMAIPAYANVKYVMRVATACRAVILRTAPIILPFVALQMRLRGQADYKIEYRYLLQQLGCTMPDGMKPGPQQ